MAKMTRKKKLNRNTGRSLERKRESKEKKTGISEKKGYGIEENDGERRMKRKSKLWRERQRKRERKLGRK
jgi:hypothetical protein